MSTNRPDVSAGRMVHVLGRHVLLPLNIAGKHDMALLDTRLLGADDVARLVVRKERGVVLEIPALR
jgi:hypothetical protein